LVIKKKSVAMHGNMNVMFQYLTWITPMQGTCQISQVCLLRFLLCYRKADKI